MAMVRPTFDEMCGEMLVGTWHEPLACTFRYGHDGPCSWIKVPERHPQELEDEIKTRYKRELRKLSRARMTLAHCYGLSAHAWNVVKELESSLSAGAKI